MKYGELVPNGLTAGDIVTFEKQREDLIRGDGWQVVRWIWEAAP